MNRNIKHLLLFCILVLLILGCNESSTESKTDEIKTYKFVNQIWIVNNLNVERYRNGDLIPEVKDFDEWKKLTTGAWCYYNNDPLNGKIYGKLYNWYAINDQRGLAPIGFHIPSYLEFDALAINLRGNWKEYGFEHWNYPNSGATKDNIFKALPGGKRNPNGSYALINTNCYFWASGSIDNLKFGVYLNNINNEKWLDGFEPNSGFSVRCIKD